jgi:hypothetical protein
MTHGVSKNRKRRTRQHVIAAQSVNYVERFIVDAGYTAERREADYGYDLQVSTFDGEGYCEPGLVYLQLKASDALEVSSSGTDYVFDLAIKDFNLWMEEVMPVLLVLFDAQKRRAWWLYVQRYFAEKQSRAPKKSAKTVRVFVPMRQRFGRRTVLAMQAWKQSISEQLWGKISHA